MRLHDLLDYHAGDRMGDELATNGTRTLTWGEAAAEANRLANGLIGLGLRPGDRVAVLSKNCLDYILLYFAASKAGLVILPLNFRLAPAELTQILADAGARLLVVGPDFAA